MRLNEFKDLRERKLQTKFVGREWLFSEIEAWLHNSRNRQVLLITGDPGVGKSALVVELVERRIEQIRNAHLLAFHICSADDQSTQSVSNFIRNISAMCSK